jgi:hypothetical protein
MVERRRGAINTCVPVIRCIPKTYICSLTTANYGCMLFTRKCHFHCCGVNPPRTIEQSSKIPSNLSISSLNLKFSFLKYLSSPVGADVEFLEIQFVALFPRPIKLLAGEPDRGDASSISAPSELPLLLPTVNVSSSSTPNPESLHSSTSSSDCGVIGESDIVARPRGSVISVRRDA